MSRYPIIILFYPDGFETSKVPKIYLGKINCMHLLVCPWVCPVVPASSLSMKPVFSTLRLKFGHSCLGYIDDSLYTEDSYAQCEVATHHAVELLISLGFMIHPLKYAVVPTQVIEFLGFILDSTNMTVRLPDRKIAKISSLCQTFCQENKSFTIRQVASLLGSLTSCFSAVEFGRLHYRNSERDKMRH